MDGRWIDRRDFRSTPKPKRHDDRDGASEMRVREQAEKQRALERLQRHRRVAAGVGKT
jgi:hypothetical protein